MPRMTEQIKKKLRDELNTLEHELAFDIPKEIKKAVAMGDLSENAAGMGRRPVKRLAREAPQTAALQ